MRRKPAFLALCLAAALLLAGAGLVYIRSGEAENSAPFDTSAPNAPDGELVRTVEGTSPEMLSPAYWTRGGADELLFSTGEIEDFNRNNPPYVEYYSAAEARFCKLFMLDLPETLPGDTVEMLIGPGSVMRFAYNGPYYINAALPGDDYWTSMQDNLALDRIPDSVVPRYAVCVRRTLATVVPSGDFASPDPEERFFNDFISAEVMPFTGVVVLHESADGEWAFVLNGSYCGWVRRDTLALCTGREEWLSATQPERFLLVTGCEIVMDETAVPSPSSGMILPMGTKLRLCEHPAELIHGHSSFGCYCVELPCRDDDGMLAWEQTLVPVSADVHVGYLSMRAGSVLEQAFKFLGRVYGYGGSLSSNDCSGFIRQVYACYGFELPRNARAIAIMTDLGSVDSAGMTRAKKLDILLKMPAGLPLFMDGHIMLYLGTDDGKPYVISSCATVIEPGHDPAELVRAYCVFVSGLDMVRANGNTWLDELKFILWKEF